MIRSFGATMMVLTNNNLSYIAMRARITGISSLAAASLLFPALALAQTTTSPGLFGILNLATRFLNAVLALFVLVAVVVFFWGLIKYLYSVDEKKHEGLQTMIWGIIAIFVMVSIWGLVRILQQTIGISPTDTALTPAGVYPRTI